MRTSIAKLKKGTLKFFIAKLIAFFAIAFVCDHIIGSVLRYFYFKQQSGVDYRTTYSLEKTKADLLISGSSRANHHYKPDVFEKSFGLSSYNIGEDGNTILNDYAALKSILKRYSPKVIILDFKAGEFVKNQEGYDQLSTLLPYYNSHPELRPIINLKSPFEKIKMLSSIYPYNSIAGTILAGNMSFYKDMRGDTKGYVPLKDEWKGSLQIDQDFNKYKIDSIKMKFYESFIKDCINSNVRLFIVCSPYLIRTPSNDISIIMGRQIAGKYNVPFFDFSRSRLFANQSKLFADNSHLNDKGAQIFSTMIADSLLNKSGINHSMNIAFDHNSLRQIE